MKIECWPDCIAVCPFREERIEGLQAMEDRAQAGFKDLPTVKGLEPYIETEASIFCSAASLEEHPHLGQVVVCHAVVSPPMFGLRKSTNQPTAEK